MMNAVVFGLAATFASVSGHAAALEDSVRGCLRALVPVASDAVPQSEQFEPAACAGMGPDRAFRYDRSSGGSRLARSLAAGDVVPHYPEYGLPVVVPGQTLMLTVAVDHVRVERKVLALQEARSGDRLFVESSDGRIWAARYEAAGK